MGREDYNISDKKYNHALSIIASGESNISEISREVKIDWRTAKKIYQDPDTHEMIMEQANDLIKNSLLKLTKKLLDKADNAQYDRDQIEAINKAMALGGMSPTEKHEVKQDVSNGGHLGAILTQLHQAQASSGSDDDDD